MGGPWKTHLPWKSREERGSEGSWARRGPGSGGDSGPGGLSQARERAGVRGPAGGAWTLWALAGQCGEEPAGPLTKVAGAH